jgi:phosphopantothenoylcysteine synthetase/decarboxylase
VSDAARWLYVVASAAPPVLRLEEFVTELHGRGWQVCVIATPTAASWIDLDSLSAATGCLARVHAGPPGQQESLPRAEAVVAAPLTFNSINKWAAGISDTVALGVLNEMLGVEIPMVAVPCVKPALQKHPAYRQSLERLTDAGVSMVDSVVGRGSDGLAVFDWHAIIAALDTNITRSSRHTG